MTMTIQSMVESDRQQVIDIFNYYVEHSFAAFPETRLPYQAFDLFLQMPAGRPGVTLKDPTGGVMGYGMLRPFKPFPNFSHTAEITYFLSPDHTGQGLGGRLLAYLETEGRKQGISILLAEISSLNPGSLNFHRKNGFVDCGCFQQVGKKKGQIFDVVWMKKRI